MSAVTESIKRLEQALLPFKYSDNVPKSCLPDYSHYDAQNLPTDYKPVDGKSYARYTKKIVSPENDKSEYSMIRLKNGLEALCISDPQTDQAAVALNVKAATDSEPDEIPGLAHLLEHVLFLGSEKYPGISDYKDFVLANGGVCNAGTTVEWTQFHASIHPTKLYNLADMLSQFLICPSFDADAIEGAVATVNSEFINNYTSNGWKHCQILRQLWNSEHPYTKFSTGNTETLLEEPRRRGIDIREELIKFYEDHYSANLMKVTILGQESLDELEHMVEEIFGQIENKNLPPAVWEMPLYGSNTGQTFVRMESSSDTKELAFCFPYLQEIAYFAFHPEEFLKFYLASERENSLYAHLKEKGYASKPIKSATVENLLSGEKKPSNSFEIRNGTEPHLQLSVFLTEYGSQHLEDVIKIVFDYLSFVRKNPPPEEYLKELSAINSAKFRFNERNKTKYLLIRDQCRCLTYPIPREWILSLTPAEFIYDSKVIQDILDTFTIQNCVVVYMSKDKFPDNVDVQTEPIYQTKHSISPLPSKLVQDCSDRLDITKFTPIKHNPFIATDFTIHGQLNNKNELPEIIRQNDISRAWYKQVNNFLEYNNPAKMGLSDSKDNKWNVPKGYVTTSLESRILSDTPQNKCLASLFVDVLSDNIRDITHSAFVAGIECIIRIESAEIVQGKFRSPDSDICFEGPRIFIQLSGFTEKIPELFNNILKNIKNFSVDWKSFNTIKEQCKRNLKNFSFQHVTMFIVEDMLKEALSNKLWSTEEICRFIDDVQPSDLEKYSKSVLSELFAESLVFGNFTRETALSISLSIENILGYRAIFPVEERKNTLFSLLPKNSGTTLRSIAIDNKRSSTGVIQYIYGGESGIAEMVAPMRLLEKILNSHAVNMLRTKENLSYLLAGKYIDIRGHSGLYIVLQGEKSATYLDSRMVECFYELEDLVRNMTAEKFEECKEAVYKTLTGTSTMRDEHIDLWSQIAKGSYDFQQKMKCAERLRNLTKKEVADFVRRYCHRDSPSRTKLSIQLQSQILNINAFEFLLLATKRHEITVPVAMQEYINNKPLYKECRDKLLNEFLPMMNISNKVVEKEIIGLIQDIAGFETPEGEYVATSLDELRAIMKPAPPIKPAEDNSFDLATFI